MKISAVIFSVLVGTVSAHTLHPPADFQVAFFGDSRIEVETPPLFLMLRARGVDMIVHAGDLSYSRDQDLIFDTVDRVMGPDFPFVAALGNHDLDPHARSNWYDGDWVRGYQEKLTRRHLAAGVTCAGVAGEMEVCFYNGIVVVNLSYKLLIDWRRWYKPEHYVAFINEAFGELPHARWRICNFHKPDNNVFSAVMNACKAWGAVIANGHKHSYLRTDYLPYGPYDSSLAIGGSTDFELGPGRSIQWVSGLGGETPEKLEEEHTRPDTAVVWPVSDADAAIASSGAVICRFNPEGLAPDQANCEFVDIDGRTLDTFRLRSHPLTPVLQ